MSQQNPLTLIMRIEKDRISELRDCLSKIKYELEAGCHELFENTNNIHYLRWVIIDDKIHDPLFFKGDERKPKLVFSSNFDGSLDDHLKGMCVEAESLIDEIYGCCKDYPKHHKLNLESRIKYLKAHKVKASAFYIGARGRTVKQILDEDKLRISIKELLDNNDWGSMGPKEIHRSLRKKLLSSDEFSWAKKPFKMPRINYFNMILLGLTIASLLPVIIVWILIVQFGYEKNDKYFTKNRSDLEEKKTKFLEEYEDLGKEGVVGSKNCREQMFYQNQFSQLVEMKEGKVRLITFKAMMLFARVLIPNLFVKGKLMNIPTIHFARWVLFDDNKRVLFFSNFDGSWQQYLGDFIDQSGWGLTGIFSNTKCFPKTKFLFTGGAYDEEHFLAWSRNSELSTQIWYSAYPELSIKNVNNNSHIRVLLSKNLSNKGAKKFFELI